MAKSLRAAFSMLQRLRGFKRLRGSSDYVRVAVGSNAGYIFLLMGEFETYLARTSQVRGST